jgi:clathrin heavy chain
MNPVQKILALAKTDAKDANLTNLQIINLETNQKNSTQINAPLKHWTWLDAKTIGIVTPNDVRHWTVGQNPVTVFQRQNTAATVLGYSVSSDKKWLLLNGCTVTPGSNTINGSLQVYSVDNRSSQKEIPAHAACFVTAKVDGQSAPGTLFCFPMTNNKFVVMQLNAPSGVAPLKKQAALPLQPGDFPMNFIPDNKYGMVYIVSKMGFLFVYEVQSATLIHHGPVSGGAPVSCSCSSSAAGGGATIVDQNGVLQQINIDEKSIVRHVTQTLNNPGLGLALSTRFNIGGAETSSLFRAQFEQMVRSNQIDSAINLVCTSPGDALRNQDTINVFKQVDPSGGKLLMYFQTLLKSGALNVIESIELVRLIMGKNHPQGVTMITNWVRDAKLTPSENLGDVLKAASIQVALSVYLKANAHDKVISCFLSMGAQSPDEEKAAFNFNQVLNYAKQMNLTPDYSNLVAMLLSAVPARAKDFALLLLAHPDGPKLDIQSTVNLFLSHNDIKDCTEIILKYLRPRGDLEEDADLQTKVFQINIQAGFYDVVQLIFESQDFKFTHYNKLMIAQLCEQNQLFQFALDNYTDITDVKRVLANAARIPQQFLIGYFGRLGTEDGIDILRDLLRSSPQRNLEIVVHISKAWIDKFGAMNLIRIFEEFQSLQGIFYFLKDIVDQIEEPDVVFKFIEAATLLSQFANVGQVCQTSEHYDPERVKEFLISRQLKDPRPLIHVCNRNGYISELTQYLYQNQKENYLLRYVQHANVNACPQVVGTLLDLNASEEHIRNLLSGVRPAHDSADFVDRLVEEVERRGRLKIIRSWIEERMKEDSQDPAVYSGAAKIYIDLNINPQQFLRENKLYDPKVVGQYCETRDPNLAMIVYRRSPGTCDEEFIRVTNDNGLFKDQAKYLVARCNNDLWQSVLHEDNEHRRSVIDQVVATALPEQTDAEVVSSTVKAFMAANLQVELIELLERLIIHGSEHSEFSTNSNLQNLLILTAMRVDTKRVMGYVERLEHYDGNDIAKIALSDAHACYEEAFFIFKKFKRGEECIQVLLEQLDSMERAMDFAEAWDIPEHQDSKEVWSLLGIAQLQKGMVTEAIASFIKADDASQFQHVIIASKNGDHYEALIQFIGMARTKTRDAALDNELLYAYAKLDRLGDLEEFIVGSHLAKLPDVGDLCFNEGLYRAARILFRQTNRPAKLALCLVKLELYDDAVDAARQASSVNTWKDVCFACVDAKEFVLASRCGIHIIVLMDHLQDLVRYYENRGYFNELMSLLEQGLNLERVHQGIYTSLGVMYSRYKEEKLMDHIKFFYQRLNMTTLLQECRKSRHWNEVVFLYSHWDQNDNALEVMMEHSADCWDNKHFKELLANANTEICYRALDFYLLEHPLLLGELLGDLQNRLEASRVVHKFRQAQHLPLIKSYLLQVQRENSLVVNEAINEILFQEDDFKALRESVTKYTEFDQIALAQKIERHDLLEFRRIAALLFRLNKKYAKSIEVCKIDSLWQDATETAAESKNPEVAENLLKFFVAQGNSSSFAATLFACYDLLRADFVMELAWRNNLMDYAMPFMIQSVFHYNQRLDLLTAKVEAAEKKEKDEEDARRAQEEEDQDLYNPVVPDLLEAPPMGMGMGMGGMPMGGMNMGGYVDPSQMGGGMGYVDPSQMGGMGMGGNMGMFN